MVTSQHVYFAQLPLSIQAPIQWSYALIGGTVYARYYSRVTERLRLKILPKNDYVEVVDAGLIVAAVSPRERVVTPSFGQCELLR
jgi:hypothetical protein